MSRVIKTWRDPYDAGFNTCRRKEVEFKPGMTVLVGCNGAGKTTMLKNIRAKLKMEDIPVFFFDNVNDGGNHSISESLFRGDTTWGAMAMCSSEGENITMNLGKCALKLRQFLKTGDDGSSFHLLAQTLDDMRGTKKEEKVTNECWILLDAMDSGYSIDNIIEMKEFFKEVMDDAKSMGVELYIIISSNEYELACDSDCMDVTEGKYVTFTNYDEYKKYIMHTRKKKDRIYE